MTPIRITYVIPTLDQSGAEKQLALLACGLPRDRFSPEVIALNRDGFYGDQLRQAGIPVHVLRKRFRIDPITHFRLRGLLHARRPAIVHAWLFAANTHVRLLKSRRTEWKCVVSERCVDSWKAGWQLSLDRRLISRTDALLANSQSVANFYRGPQVGVPAALVHTITNGIQIPETPVDSPAHHARRAAFRRRWGFPEDAFVIGSIGRLAPQKRTETLLWTMHMLKLAVPQTRALFVGSGPEWGQLQELAEKYDVASHVAFAGHQADAAQFHSCWDAFWLASDFEGQSNSLLEAMAAGVPVVASDIPPNRELITSGTHGLLVPVGDSAGFAVAMRRLIEQPELAKQYAEAALDRLQTEFSVQRMIDQHVQLYEQLLSRPAGS